MHTEDRDSETISRKEGASIARKVKKLLKSKGAKAPFQAGIWNWKKQRDEQVASRDAWRRERDEFFCQKAANNPRLQEKNAGPPAEDWQYEVYTPPHPDGGEGADRTEIRAWCPPNLLWENEPRVDSPLSFCDCDEFAEPTPQDPDRPLSIDEKFVVCAAIHDAFVKGRDKIDPWSDHPDDFVASIVEGGAYKAVRCAVKDLHKADLFNIEAILEDVKAQLESDLGKLKARTDVVMIGGSAIGAKASEKETEPNEQGYVVRPPDSTAYVPASVIRIKRTPTDIVVTERNLPKILRAYRTNRVRWTRPLGLDGKPRENRLSVHLADWLAWIERQRKVQSGADDDGWPVTSANEHKKRAAEIRRQRPAG